MALSVIELIFFVYTFLSLYLLSLFILIYIQHRKDLFSYPRGKPEPVSIVVPCYNDKETIGKAIESLLDMNYPRDMIEIIVVDDKSTDGSAEIVRNYEKKYSNVRLIVNKKNSGGAAEPTNIGIRASKYDYIVVADSDSMPEKDALIKMMGFLQADKKVGGVTCSIMAKHRRIFIEKLQAIEYSVIAFTRKLLDFVDAIYVTPGPFALYRKKTLIEIGLFDEKNITQDIEIVWRLVYNGYYARMCLPAKTYSVTPVTWKSWFRQRVRWNIGGLQTIMKYKGTFLKKGMLGFFILPFFVISLFIGVLGVIIFLYLMARRFWLSYLATKFSLYVGTDIIRFSEFNLNPSILNFFGFVLFIMGLFFTLFALSMMGEKKLKNKRPFSLIFYLLVYLTLYPIILIIGIFKFLRGKYSW